MKKIDVKARMKDKIYDREMMLIKILTLESRVSVLEHICRGYEPKEKK